MIEPHRTLLPEFEKWYLYLKGRGRCLACILKNDLEKALEDVSTMEQYLEAVPYNVVIDKVHDVYMGYIIIDLERNRAGELRYNPDRETY